MGLISKIVKLGAAAGAAYAAVKVSDKFKEENPEGIEDTAVCFEQFGNVLC